MTVVRLTGRDLAERLGHRGEVVGVTWDGSSHEARIVIDEPDASDP